MSSFIAQCFGSPRSVLLAISILRLHILRLQVQRAVKAAAVCREERCHGHGTCFGCVEPYAMPFAECACDCDDGHTGNVTCSSGGQTPPAPPAPPPVPPAPPPAPPAPPACPGGSLVACMEVCPSSPVIAYKDCVDECVKRCTVVTAAARLSVNH